MKKPPLRAVLELVADAKRGQLPRLHKIAKLGNPGDVLGESDPDIMCQPVGAEGVQRQSCGALFGHVAQKYLAIDLAAEVLVQRAVVLA